MITECSPNMYPRWYTIIPRLLESEYDVSTITRPSKYPLLRVQVAKLARDQKCYGMNDHNHATEIYFILTS